MPVVLFEKSDRPDVKGLIEKYRAIFDWDAAFLTEVCKPLTAREYLAN